MKHKPGKIEHDFFKAFIADRCGKKRAEIATGPKFGVDVSVVNLANGQAIAMASDPLSLIPTLGLQESAWLSVQLTANDIATTGFAPLYGQFVLNLPADMSQNDFQCYWEYIHKYSTDIGLAITGGHTGFVEGQDSTIAGGATFLTVAPTNEILTSANAKPGDHILVTKTSAMSSAAILALGFPQTVKNRIGTENHRKACEAFYDLSVLPDAMTAVAGENRPYITAMHDVTEGGILGAIFELANASGNGALVYDGHIPINEVQASVCEVFSLDPRYCIGAGAMVMTCKKEASAKIIRHLEHNNIPCCHVGRITEKTKGILLERNGRSTNMEYFENDPYWEAFYKAVKSGWK